uniref:ComC family protein n=1 Tax=Siphoviridae sp. ctnot10 TaxID=2826458 RepID=A0A8S5ND99_9CAUD|nr:MAG TPA: ComC family protein [Siphoviridae sp. ctnot10]DAL17674.1 MAG TPA_asm: ComC family protein [Caudoviricetes sp.]
MKKPNNLIEKFKSISNNVLENIVLLLQGLFHII